MTLKLFNSGSTIKEAFRPLRKNVASLYVCGVTPYDTTHLGHAFTYTVFDTLGRYLMHKGFGVVYTQNVTDIDDDILRRSKKEGRDWRELGDFWTRRFLDDMKSINVMRPTHYVKATASMPRIIRMVGRLLEKGFAYRSGNNVYFDVKKFPRYGSLSHFNTRQMEMLLRERGGNPLDANKRNPLDFILWQGWTEGEPYWNTPWGRGRPGWHIECSAMANEYLGDRIDIHGGGRDLIFPHHESEIAQSESYTGKRPFSRFFMHTAMVMYMGEKMSKSLGNLVLVSHLIKTHTPNAIRWLLLSHHYRQVWEYDEQGFDEAEHFSEMIGRLHVGRNTVDGSADESYMSEFEQAMDDDLNTPQALRMFGALLDNGKDDATARRIARILGFIV